MKMSHRRQLLWFLVSMGAYVVVLVVSLSFLKSAPSSPWRIPVSLAPVVPIVFVVWGVIRATRDMDELERKTALEGTAFAQTTVIVASITYGFLQNVGFPAINWMWVGVALIGLSGLGRLLAQLKYR